MVFDWLEGRDLSLKASRLLTIMLGELVIVAALAAPLLGKTVIDIIMTIAGTLLGGLLAVFLLGMFVRRANAAGVLIGLSAGSISMIVVAFATEIPNWWYGAFVIFPTLIIGTLASHLFAPPTAKALAGTIWSRRATSEGDL